ncbi:MAG: LemA family protein [Candidatus Krumholzibacteriota bacterium]|nr:LemA family protein [Candidatus Krumholzibacteriota bacterium]
MKIEIIALLSAAAALALWIAVIFNRLITYRNRCTNAASQIDIQLKFRYRLIPELVDVVKGYAAHEKNLLDDVTKKRTEALESAGQKESEEAEKRLSSSLKTIFALKEQYPSLKASDNFLRLQKQLSEIEDKIRFSRQFYNDIVMRYNTLISSFPNLILAKTFHFTEKGYFDISDI